MPFGSAPSTIFPAVMQERFHSCVVHCNHYQTADKVARGCIMSLRDLTSWLDVVSTPFEWQEFETGQIGRRLPPHDVEVLTAPPIDRFYQMGSVSLKATLRPPGVSWAQERLMLVRPTTSCH